MNKGLGETLIYNFVNGWFMAFHTTMSYISTPEFLKIVTPFLIIDIKDLITYLSGIMMLMWNFIKVWNDYEDARRKRRENNESEKQLKLKNEKPI